MQGRQVTRWPGWIGELPWRALEVGHAGGGHAWGVLSIWMLVENLSHHWHRLQAVQEGGFFLFRAASYQGQAHQLVDGRMVKKGDRVIELHLDNRRLSLVQQALDYRAWQVVHGLREDLAVLLKRVRSGQEGEVVALHGVSLTGAAGGLLGFEVQELKHTWQNALLRYFLVGLDAVYHKDGLERLKGHWRERWPCEIWMDAAREAA